MAFKTRAGRTVAIGHGLMTTVWLTWRFTHLLLLGPLSLSALAIVWFAIVESRPLVEGVLPSVGGFATGCLALLTTRSFAVSATYSMVFIAPEKPTPSTALKRELLAIRSRLTMLLRSSTAWWCVASFSLMVGLWLCASLATEPWATIGFVLLSIALVWADLRAGRGLALIYRTNRRAPYFEGMDAAQKQAADQPPLFFKKPSFPPVNAVPCAEDARRYARRAKAIADIHTWLGAGIIVVFSAFVGTTISALWEVEDKGIMIVPVLLVLGSLALGFGVQRRSREYLRLSEELRNRADELEKPARLAMLIERLTFARPTRAAPLARTTRLSQ